MRFPFMLGPKKSKGDGIHYADLYARSVAAAIDVLLMFLLLNDLFQTITNHIREKTITGSAPSTDTAMTAIQFFQLLRTSHFFEFWLINTAVQTIILGVLIVSCQIAFSTTPGKWIMGLKIVDAKTMEPPSAWQFIIRFFGYIVAVLPLMIGVFLITFNRKRRGWHDVIAGTVVLDMRASGWYWKKIKQGWRYLFKKEAKQELPPAE